MTCIKFYTGFSGKQININDLYNRIAYLYKAEEHLKTYLDTKNRPSADIRTHLTTRLSSTGHEEGLAVMSISTEETFRHINCIKLQVEVTEYLYKCYNKKGNKHAICNNKVALNVLACFILSLFKLGSSTIDIHYHDSTV